MVRINNTDLMNELRDVAKIQVGSDIVPNVMSNQVVPVVDVNPKHSRISRPLFASTRSLSGAGTIGTTNSNKDTFVTGFMFDIIKDAACDMATGAVTFTGVIDGAIKSIGGLSVLTLTAQNSVISLELSNPVKLDRNTTILFSNSTYAAGVCSRSCVIFGYETDNINA